PARRSAVPPRYHLSIFSGPRSPRLLPPFPTRRSSDLDAERASHSKPRAACDSSPVRACSTKHSARASTPNRCASGRWTDGLAARSEEHTSELQSRENLVCRLLLEKKNKNNESAVL